MLRFFADEAEIDNFAKRQASGQYGTKIASLTPSVDDTTFHAPYGGVAMQHGGKLDTRSYLIESRAYFGSRYQRCDLNLDEDITVSDESIVIPRLSIRCDQLIFCQGYEAHRNRWFAGVKFKPAKGEILTLRIEGFDDPRVYHRGVWLARTANGMYQTGATYDWNHLDSKTHGVRAGRSPNEAARVFSPFRRSDRSPRGDPPCA